LFGTVYDTPARYAFIDGPVPDRIEVDLDGVLAMREGAWAFAEAIPAISAYANMRVRHGAPGYTPDGRALVGAVPAIAGLHVIAGCNEQGVTYGPGLGR